MADDPQVTLKPSAVDVKQDAPAKPDLPPYHTEETFKIAQQRQKDADKQKDQPYKFEANGYTVTAEKVADGALQTYVVKADGFDRGGYTQRDAEIYAMTHDENHKTQPGEVSKS